LRIGVVGFSGVKDFSFVQRGFGGSSLFGFGFEV